MAAYRRLVILETREAARCEWPRCALPAVLLADGRGWCKFHWEHGERLRRAADRPEEHAHVWALIAKRLNAGR